MQGKVTYSTPPLVEVAVSFFYEPLEINPGVFGAFWSKLRTDFPKTRTLPPLAPYVDGLRNYVLHGPRRPIQRFQLISSDEQWLCQMQLERFTVNWRKGGEDYPRYDRVSQRFFVIWNKWNDFCEEYGIGVPKVAHCEVMYLNKINGGVGKLLEFMPGLLPRGLDNMELAQTSSSWRTSEENGLSAQIDVRQSAGSDESIFVTIASTASVNGTKALEQALDLTHSSVISLFEQIFSDKAKSEWGRYEQQA